MDSLNLNLSRVLLFVKTFREEEQLTALVSELGIEVAETGPLVFARKQPVAYWTEFTKDKDIIMFSRPALHVAKFVLRLCRCAVMHLDKELCGCEDSPSTEHILRVISRGQRRFRIRDVKRSVVASVCSNNRGPYDNTFNSFDLQRTMMRWDSCTSDFMQKIHRHEN